MAQVHRRSGRRTLAALRRPRRGTRWAATPRRAARRRAERRHRRRRRSGRRVGEVRSGIRTRSPFVPAGGAAAAAAGGRRRSPSASGRIRVNECAGSRSATHEINRPEDSARRAQAGGKSNARRRLADTGEAGSAAASARTRFARRRTRRRGRRSRQSSAASARLHAGDAEVAVEAYSINPDSISISGSRSSTRRS